ncbi:MAG: putative transposase [Candidatus Xenolissoclinum pacificiensis L6]|uniref:Transposase n=1 Tax=Candidatus Xenolissoclinum pacificiensis L6 TaxID=1401685 RepID=W2V247_9RICK|nr:MAG: putative transposase [Candidatus Xenolissoclinum pacificiensis L6]
MDKTVQKCCVRGDLQEVMIDSTIVRAHVYEAGYSKEEEGLGRSKGGFTSKIHALVDTLGNPLKFILIGENRNDIIKAEALKEDMKSTTVITDKGYDSKKLHDHLDDKQCKIVIPPRRNRKVQYEYDKHIYIERQSIECFCGKLKHFIRVSSRFDKTKSSYQAFIDFATTLIYLR